MQKLHSGLDQSSVVVGPSQDYTDFKTDISFRSLEAIMATLAQTTLLGTLLKALGFRSDSRKVDETTPHWTEFLNGTAGTWK